MTLRFNDGTSRSAPAARIEIVRERDGLYVVGYGMLCAVESRAKRASN